jgi:hypothetical protein
MEKTITMPEQHESHLEPRVARLETGLETLTRNVSEMAVSIRENANATNQKIDGLIVAVTNAQAPRMTDWSLFLSIGFFILALGSAVFWPLNKTAQDNKDAIGAVQQKFESHLTLPAHPLAQAKIDALTKEVEVNRAEMAKRDEQLDTKIQRETQLMTDLLSARLEGLDKRLQVEMGLKNEIISAKLQCMTAGAAVHEHADELERKIAEAELRVIKEKNDLYIEKLFGRVVTLEQERTKVADNEHAELMQWRQKAMGLSAPDAYVPLVQRGGVVEPKK